MGSNMSMGEYIYSPILEEPVIPPEQLWEKQTVQFAVDHRTKIIQLIKSAVRTVYKNTLPKFDIEDIYGEVIEYLLKCEDYDIEKAIERSKDNESGTIVTLEAYVSTSIKYCVKRYITARYQRDKMVISDIISDEDKETRLTDIIPDAKAELDFEGIGLDLESTLKSLESKRYVYQADIFLVLYVRMATASMSDETYMRALDVLGIPKKKLGELEKQALKDEDVLTVVKAISLAGNEEARDTLRKYVYSSEIVDHALKMI